MTVGPKKTRFIFNRGNRLWLLLFLLCLQVRTFLVSLWSVSEVSYLSVTADIHMSHFSNFTKSEGFMLSVGWLRIMEKLPTKCLCGHTVGDGSHLLVCKRVNAGQIAAHDDALRRLGAELNDYGGGQIRAEG